jgi:hypothetical protein
MGKVQGWPGETKPARYWNELRATRPSGQLWAWAGSCSPSLLESLLASLDELGGLALARRLGAIGLSGEHGRQRGKCTRTRTRSSTPRPRPLLYDICLSI